MCELGLIEGTSWLQSRLTEICVHRSLKLIKVFVVRLSECNCHCKPNLICNIGLSPDACLELPVFPFVGVFLLLTS